MSAKRFKTGELPDVLRGDGNAGIGGFHHLNNIVFGFAEDNHTDELRAQSRIAVISIYNKIMGLSAEMLFGIVLFHGKPANLTARLAGVDEALHIFNVGFDGRSKKRELGFRRLYQIVLEIG